MWKHVKKKTSSLPVVRSLSSPMPSFKNLLSLDNQAGSEKMSAPIPCDYSWWSYINYGVIDPSRRCKVVNNKAQYLYMSIPVIYSISGVYLTTAHALLQKCSRAVAYWQRIWFPFSKANIFRLHGICWRKKFVEYLVPSCWSCVLSSITLRIWQN